jgi:hypothetical protein
MPHPQKRSITVSNVLYGILYDVHSMDGFSIPATWPPGEPHYGCTVRVYAISSDVTKASKHVAEFEAQWTKEGCWEDDPLMVVGRALKWTRYPSNGKGYHWMCKGPAMWMEPDEPESTNSATQSPRWPSTPATNYLRNIHLSTP